MPTLPGRNTQEQVHIDLGALAQRVTGLEGSIVAIGTQLDNLAKKLDGKPTNWWTVIGGVVSMLVLIGGVFAQAIAPINSDLGRHERDISHIAETAINRADYLRDRDETERWLDSLRDRFGDTVSQRQLTELKERLDERYKITQDADKTLFARTMERLDAIDGQLVKRPEIEAANRSTNDRINTIGNGLHEVQSQIESAFPPSKVIEDIQRSLSELRATRSGSPQTPGR